MRERSVFELTSTSVLMAGAFIFIWLNLATGPVIGIAIAATILHMLGGG